jgi:phosphatidylinositol alpha-1,6-mannosyltransferase
MKSLLITSVFPPMTGGSGRWFWEMYRRLPREAFAVVAGEHSDAAGFDAAQEFNIHRLPLHLPDYGVFSIAGVNRYRPLARQVSHIIGVEAATLVHCGALLPDGWIGRQVAGKLGIPYLVYLHGEELCYTESSRELNWMARRILRGAETVIANSRNTEQIALEHWRVPPEKVRVVHPGVDTNRFRPAPPNRHEREQLRWGNRPVILTVGRLQKRKGHEILIAALPAIRERIPRVLYAIVGSGPEHESLLNLVAQLKLQDHVLFHGNLSDDRLISCYQQCDLFVLPNRRLGGDIEGFGMVLLEAQACGKPVIAGASGGTAETIDVPHTGRLVESESANLLAEEVIRILADPDVSARMGDKARQWAVKRFDWSQATSRLLGCIHPRCQLVVAAS